MADINRASLDEVVISMVVYVKGMKMPSNCWDCPLVNTSPCACKGYATALEHTTNRHPDCPLVPVPPHGQLKKRVVYRVDVYDALESARINALDGILTNRYKDGFHDGLKRALEILANEVQDAPTIIEAEEET